MIEPYNSLEKLNSEWAAVAASWETQWAILNDIAIRREKKLAIATSLPKRAQYSILTAVFIWEMGELGIKLLVTHTTEPEVLNNVGLLVDFLNACRAYTGCKDITITHCDHQISLHCRDMEGIWTMKTIYRK